MKALCEGSDWLTRLQRAVGLLRTELQDDGLVIDSIVDEIHDREGAVYSLVNSILRQSQLVTQESLFGCNPYLEPSNGEKSEGRLV